mmetsp:Transcript_90805/g.265808  ORF Transcript_90805/g.265808 Transcript_90805/m.265808 type:complete len:271 (+) Transcript_90805:95-907(+)
MTLLHVHLFLAPLALASAGHASEPVGEFPDAMGLIQRRASGTLPGWKVPAMWNFTNALSAKPLPAMSDPVMGNFTAALSATQAKQGWLPIPSIIPIGMLPFPVVIERKHKKGHKHHSPESEKAAAGKQDQSANQPVPKPVTVEPKMAVTGQQDRSARHQLAPHKFWQPKYDPDWQPDMITHTPHIGKPAVRKIVICEDIRSAAECATSYTTHGLRCLGWGGHHCLPLMGAKCSEITSQTVCEGGALGLKCMWNHKGCVSTSWGLWAILHR